MDTLTPEQQRKLDLINKMPLTIEKDAATFDPDGKLTQHLQYLPPPSPLPARPIVSLFLIVPVEKDGSSNKRRTTGELALLSPFNGST